MPRFYDCFLDQRHHLEKRLDIFFCAEAHHPFDTGAVVPASIKDHDLTGRGQVADITLEVDLRLLTLGRLWKSHDTKHTRADTLCNGFDGAALPCSVTSLEKDADLQVLVDCPQLQLHQLYVQSGELTLVILFLELPTRRFGFSSTSVISFMPRPRCRLCSEDDALAEPRCGLRQHHTDPNESIDLNQVPG